VLYGVAASQHQLYLLPASGWCSLVPDC